METFIALLRGVNLAGKRRVEMAGLRDLAKSLGCESVQTVLQSGNLVVRSALSAAALESELETAAMAEFGFPIELSVRTRPDLEQIVANNPFPAEAHEDPSHLLVMFLRDRLPADSALAWLKKQRGPEKIQHSIRELFIYYPEGIGRSQLRVPFSGTARNWNTVLRLRELAGVAAP